MRAIHFASELVSAWNTLESKLSMRIDCPYFSLIFPFKLVDENTDVAAMLAQVITKLKEVAEALCYPYHLPSYRTSKVTTRGQLSEYACVAQRWSDICSSSHPLLKVLSAKADTIV
jgi:hypothetical protein